MKRIFIADVHAGGGWIGKPITGDVDFYLEQVLEAVDAHGVEEVFAAGDILDRQRNRAAPVHSLLRFLDGLRDRSVRLHFIQGQHDFDDPPWLASHEAAWHLNHCHTTSEPRVVGLDFLPAGELQETLKTLPANCPILMAHQAWAQWMGSVTNPQGDFNELPAHLSHLYSGDLHQAICKKYRGAGGQPVDCCSSGAASMQAINEPEEHYYALLDGLGPFELVKVKSRLVLRDALFSEDDIGRFMATIGRTLEAALAQAAYYPEAVRLPILEVTYSHSLPDVTRRVGAVLAGKAHLFWKELPPPEKTRAARSVAAVGGRAITPLDVLPDELSRQDEPDAYALVEQLLTAPDPEQVFAAWRQAMMDKLAKAIGGAA
jgi:hypothetical protein